MHVEISQVIPVNPNRGTVRYEHVGFTETLDETLRVVNAMDGDGRVQITYGTGKVYEFREDPHNVDDPWWVLKRTWGLTAEDVVVPAGEDALNPIGNPEAEPEPEPLGRPHGGAGAEIEVEPKDDPPVPMDTDDVPVTDAEMAEAEGREDEE